MHLAQIWRFPVKAMAGESLRTVEVDSRGLLGDRFHAVVDRDGRFACGKNSNRFRQHDEIFEFAAHTEPSGDVLIQGRSGSWVAGDPALDSVLSQAMGETVQVLPEVEVSHYDSAPVSVVGTASLAWCAAELGVDADPRRLRVNLVVETTEPFIEETWQELTVGDLTLDFVKRNTRCRVIDQVQNHVGSTTRWLKPLGDHRDAKIAVYFSPRDPATIGVGDTVTATTTAEG